MCVANNFLEKKYGGMEEEENQKPKKCFAILKLDFEIFLYNEANSPLPSGTSAEL